MNIHTDISLAYSWGLDRTNETSEGRYIRKRQITESGEISIMMGSQLSVEWLFQLNTYHAWSRREILEVLEVDEKLIL
jgi:hypothetical protein